MSNRLNQERGKTLNPKRMQNAIQKLEKRGFRVIVINDKELNFTFKEECVKFFPYTGWHTGETINDGRGINNLLNQIGFKLDDVIKDLKQDIKDLLNKHNAEIEISAELFEAITKLKIKINGKCFVGKSRKRDTNIIDFFKNMECK